MGTGLEKMRFRHWLSFMCWQVWILKKFSKNFIFFQPTQTQSMCHDTLDTKNQYLGFESLEKGGDRIRNGGQEWANGADGSDQLFPDSSHSFDGMRAFEFWGWLREFGPAVDHHLVANAKGRLAANQRGQTNWFGVGLTAPIVWVNVLQLGVVTKPAVHRRVVALVVGHAATGDGKWFMIWNNIQIKFFWPP